MAYAFARLRFPGKDGGLIVVLLGAFLPAIALALPLYILFITLERSVPAIDAFGLQDSLLGLAILYASFALPLAIWLMRAAFRAVPADLEEAAFVDGASRFLAYPEDHPAARDAVDPRGGAGGVPARLLGVRARLDVHRVGAQRDPRDGAREATTGFYTANWGLTAAYALLMALPVVIVFVILQRGAAARRARRGRERLRAIRGSRRLRPTPPGPTDGGPFTPSEQRWPEEAELGPPGGPFVAHRRYSGRPVSPARAGDGGWEHVVRPRGPGVGRQRRLVRFVAQRVPRSLLPLAAPGRAQYPARHVPQHPPAPSARGRRRRHHRARRRPPPSSTSARSAASASRPPATPRRSAAAVDEIAAVTERLLLAVGTPVAEGPDPFADPVTRRAHPRRPPGSSAARSRGVTRGPSGEHRARAVRARPPRPHLVAPARPRRRPAAASTLNGADLEALAREHGTPLFVYDLARPRENVRALQAALTRAGVPYVTRFALKACPDPRILAVLRAWAHRGRRRAWASTPARRAR